MSRGGTPVIPPFEVAAILHHRTVESSRVELKATFDDKTGPRILETICAFANDLQELNGGYIVLGVGEDRGTAQLPPRGLSPEAVENAQKWLRGHCNRLDPVYQPIFYPLEYQDRQILVVRVAPSEVRPHQAPSARDGSRKYFVRIGTETVEAKGDLLRQLLESAGRVPFDDRRNLDATVDAIRERNVREYLDEIGSGLLEEDDALEIYRRLRLLQQVNGHEVPRNIALLMFSEDPTRWFPGALIEVVHFSTDGGDVLEERAFRGPLHEQLRDCLRYLRGQLVERVEKVPGQAEARRWWSFPYEAIEEAVANALYHRGYRIEDREPVKIYVHADRIDIASYPGPVYGIELHHLEPRAKLPVIAARNRRIGDFFKDLQLAEARGTGVPKLFRAMRRNGSPDPIFLFDEARTYFQVTLPAHPSHVGLEILNDVRRLRSLGQPDQALDWLEHSFTRFPDSPAIALELAEELIKRHDLDKAHLVIEESVRRANDRHDRDARSQLDEALATLQRLRDGS